MRSLGSDNHASVHPQILQALTKANQDHAPSYGTDEISEKVEKTLKTLFGPESKAFFVFNGTAANVLAISAYLKPYQSLLCADVSHLNMDECGAPEFFTRGKLSVIPSTEGKMQLKDLEAALIRGGDQHFSQIGGISLTLPTELGTCYSLKELKEITAWARLQNLFIHIDGARFVNALVHLKLSIPDFVREVPFDVLSFGGTKNGLMFGEAVIFRNSQHSKDFKYIRKQGAQLPSKTRYVASQFEAYLNNGLYLEIAETSHRLALKLYDGVKDIPGVTVTQPPQSNAVFAKIPQAWVKTLKQKFFFYVWNEKTFECRWMISWDTTTEDVDQFIAAIKEISREIPCR